MALAVHEDMMAEDPQCCFDELREELKKELSKRHSEMLFPNQTDDTKEPLGKIGLGIMNSLKDFRSWPPSNEEKRRIFRSAKRKGAKVTFDELQEAADHFRAVSGLDRAEDTERWFRCHQISLEHFQKYLTISLLRRKVYGTFENN